MRNIKLYRELAWISYIQWNDDDVRPVLDYSTPNMIFIVLADWNNMSRIDVSLHSDALSLFRVKYSLLLPFKAALLTEM